MATVNVHDFGAVGDGVADDRAAIQRALDAGAGGMVWIRSGTYLVTQGAGAFCLSVPTGTLFVGDSVGAVILIQAPGIAANVRLLQAFGPGIGISTMTLDGNAANQAPDEHRAGIFALNAANLHVQDVTAQNFTGDGIYISIGSDSVLIEHCNCTDNGRDGLVFGGGTTGGMVRDCALIRNRIQQLDTEPGAGYRVDGVTVTGCTIGKGRGDYAITVAGSGANFRSSGWSIVDNEIDGGLEIVWADRVTVRGNKRWVNATNKPSISVYRACEHIHIVDNDLELSAPAAGVAADAVITVSGTGVGQMPNWVTIEGNRLSSNARMPHGVHMTCASDVVVMDNVITGSGIADPYAAGVYARSTVVGADMFSLVVHRNRIRNWGNLGVATAGNGMGTIIRLVSAIGNVFIDDSPTATMSFAMAIPVGLDVRAGNNTLLGGCTAEMKTRPPGLNVTMLGIGRWVV